jgi:DNA-binding transcriptional LysR family regulator
MDLDVRRLRLLREVALRGTIAAAAASLGYTPSAVSQQLSALERESGSVLLERHGRRVRLTDAGRLLVERTGAVLVALEEAGNALEASRRSVGGDLRLAASGSLARALVVPVMAEVARDWPELRVTLLEYEPGDTLQELRLGEIDLVVAHEYDHAPLRPQPDLVRVELFAEDMLVAAPRGRFVGPVALADLRHEIWAADPSGNSCGRAMRAACRTVGFEPEVRYNSSEFAVLLSAVAHAGAVALLPELAFTQAPPEIDVLDVIDVPTRRLVFGARRRGNPARPSVGLLLDRLTAAGRAVQPSARRRRPVPPGRVRPAKRVGRAEPVGAGDADGTSGADRASGAGGPMGRVRKPGGLAGPAGSTGPAERAGR